MKNPLGVSPSKWNQGTKRGKEKIFMTWVGIEPTTRHNINKYSNATRHNIYKYNNDWLILILD